MLEGTLILRSAAAYRLLEKRWVMESYTAENKDKKDSEEMWDKGLVQWSL